MTIGQEIAGGDRESIEAESRRDALHGRGSATSALFAATALYLIFALLWSAIGRNDQNYLTAAAIVASCAISIALIVALLAAQTERLTTAARSWFLLTFALLAITVVQISDTAVYVTQPRTDWNPSWRLGLQAAAAVAIVGFFAYAHARSGRSLAGLLPGLTAAAIVALGPACALTLVGWLLSDSPRERGTVLATALPLAACLIVGGAYLSSALTGPNGASAEAFGYALGVAGWAAAVLLRQIGEWRTSVGLIALGHWLLPVSALGFSTAALWSIADRNGFKSGPAHPPRSMTAEPAVVLSLVALLAAAAIGYRLDALIDLPLIAAVALAIFFAKQTATIRLTRQHVREILEASEELERAANLDQTTGLPNRAALDARMREEFERAFRYEQPLSLCVVDIDHFKSVNDRFGHAVGDIVLRAVGMSLRQSARGIDFVGRYGGEEFVIIAPGTWSADAEILAERLRAQVDRLVFASESGQSLKVTVSVGVAGYPEHAGDLDELFALADGALYQSKQRGRNRVTLHGKDEFN